MNVTFDRLRYFLEVSKLEHVGLASKSLGVSASALSSAISILEEEYQCSLFERSKQRIYLTERGRLLRERVEPILEQVISLSNEINAEQMVYRGYLSTGGSFFLADHYLQATLNSIQKKNPNLRTEVSPLRSIQVIQDVLSGVLDYGVCFSPLAHPSIEKNTLHTGEMQLVVSKKHPLAKIAIKKDFKLSDLNNYPASIHKSAPGIDFCENHPMFEKFGIQPQVQQYFHSDDLCIQSIVSQNLWAMVPEIVAKHYRSVLFTLPLPRGWEAPYEICSIYRKSMKNRGVFSHLDEQLKKIFL